MLLILLVIMVFQRGQYWKPKGGQTTTPGHTPRAKSRQIDHREPLYSINERLRDAAATERAHVGVAKLSIANAT